MAVSENQILNLKRKCEDGKKLFVQAEATTVEIERNIGLHYDELTAKGVDIKDIPADLERREKEIDSLYSEAMAKMPE